MRILHLIFSMTTGGTETMLVDIINKQVLKAQVSLLIVNNEICKPLVARLHKSVKVQKLNRKAGSRSPVSLIYLNFLILKGRYDVIHCHNENLIAFIFPAYYDKTYLTIHTTGVESKYLSRYNKIFAISEAVQIDLEMRIGLESTVILNGINFDLVLCKTIDSLRVNTFKIVQVGRLDARVKGQNIAIQAVKILVDRKILDVSIDFIGEGPSDKELKEQVKANNLEKYISFLGLKDRDYIYSNLSNYDLLIQPSFYEGFGLTVVEGMAAKIAVLVSDIEGPLEIIRKGEYGFHFRCGDAHSLAESIAKISNMGKEGLRIFTNRSYDYARHSFSIEKTAAKYIMAYKRLL